MVRSRIRYVDNVMIGLQ